MDTRYICTLSASEKLAVYKCIKATLIEADALTYENIRMALDGRVSDLEA